MVDGSPYPSDLRLNSKFTIQERMALHKIGKCGFERWAHAIIVRPSSIHEIKAAGLDETFDLILGLLLLPLIPHLKQMYVG